MSKWIFGTILVTLALTSSQGLSTQQQLPYNQEAELHAEGNIYVSSDRGKLIWMSKTQSTARKCDRPRIDRRLAAESCKIRILITLWCLQLEIYRKGGHKLIIQPGAPIGDGRFWNDGEQIAVSFGPADATATYAFYDAATGRVIEKLFEPSDESLLPQWAKSEWQIQAESVPMSAELTSGGSGSRKSCVTLRRSGLG